jgi:hypothetical protein
VVGEGGRLVLRLPARAGMVWRVAAGASTAAVPGSAALLSLDALPGAPAGADFTVSGSAPGIERVQVVVDGELARAIDATPDAQGRFQARVAVGRMIDPAVTHRVVAWAEGRGVSAPRSFRVALPWTLRAQGGGGERASLGFGGPYRYPTDPSFGPRTMDIVEARVATAGGALRIELAMKDLSRLWMPPNGFDHVAFTIFVELPGRAPGEGARVMPGQGALLPEGMRWHLRLRAHGWSNALYAPAGATAEREGTPVAPAAAIAVDSARRSVAFTIPASALGDLPSLAGARVLVTTWDYDGGYRTLARENGPFVFGGGGSGRDAKVMDAALLRIP